MMSRGTRLTIIGIIFGLLSTLATQEMRCLFGLSHTFKCHQCLAHYGAGYWFITLFGMGCTIFSIISPENFEEGEKMGLTYEKETDVVCLVWGFLSLISIIFAVSSCLK
ncbi:hypothetical protein QUB56_10545 [Microcoleus sp. AR_TQ3_B6]